MVELKHYIKHETKRSALYRFLIVLVIFVIYLAFMCIKYGLEKGTLVSLLTWSFFVFCTPIADAGFLLDFPIRVLTGIRMFYSEIMVWIIAACLNIYALIFAPTLYESTVLLKLFKYILLHPIPFWLIIIVCAIGTYMSVYFGDELIDVVSHREREKFHKHKHKHRLFIFVFIVILAVILYSFLLNELGIYINIY